MTMPNSSEHSLPSGTSEALELACKNIEDFQNEGALGELLVQSIINPTPGDTPVLDRGERPYEDQTGQQLTPDRLAQIRSNSAARRATHEGGSRSLPERTPESDAAKNESLKRSRRRLKELGGRQMSIESDGKELKTSVVPLKPGAKVTPPSRPPRP